MGTPRRSKLWSVTARAPSCRRIGHTTFVPAGLNVARILYVCRSETPTSTFVCPLVKAIQPESALFRTSNVKLEPPGVSPSPTSSTMPVGTAPRSMGLVEKSTVVPVADSRWIATRGVSFSAVSTHSSGATPDGVSSAPVSTLLPVVTETVALSFRQATFPAVEPSALSGRISRYMTFKPIFLGCGPPPAPQRPSQRRYGQLEATL